MILRAAVLAAFAFSYASAQVTMGTDYFYYNCLDLNDIAACAATFMQVCRDTAGNSNPGCIGALCGGKPPGCVTGTECECKRTQCIKFNQDVPTTTKAPTKAPTPSPVVTKAPTKAPTPTRASRAPVSFAPTTAPQPLQAQEAVEPPAPTTKPPTTGSPTDPVEVFDPPLLAFTELPPKCSGFVKGFQIYDLDTATAVYNLTDGETVALSALPKNFTVGAIAASGGEVDLTFGVTYIRTDTSAPYLYGLIEFSDLYTEGTFTFQAMSKNTPGDVACEITITTAYTNPHVCQGIVQQFALFNTDTQKIVEGYGLLANNQVLQKSLLPKNLSIVAMTNGRGSGTVTFGYLNVPNYLTTKVTPFAISGTDASGKVLPWTVLNEKKAISFSATSVDRLSMVEPASKACSLVLHIEQDWKCPNTVMGFTLMYARKSVPNVVPGYEKMLGFRALDLGDVGDFNVPLSIQALSNKTGVDFYVNGKYQRTENAAPLAIAGDSGGQYHEAAFLRVPGTYVIEAKHSSETLDKNCKLTLTVQRDLTIKTIDNTEVCGVEQIVPETVGNVMFHKMPVKVVDRVTNSTVSFKTMNTIFNGTVGWVTTSFVTPHGIRVCDKASNLGFGAEPEYSYEAKCFDGFAFADVYAYSDQFPANQATANTIALPLACKNSFAGKVVKYTFVFSCDCANIPDIPDEFTGGVVSKPDTCTGVTASTWGDPHIVPWNGDRGDQWNCQGEGEFILAKADLVDYAYDFEMRARFTDFQQTLPWTFNSAMVAKQDVTVEISMGEKKRDKSNMFDNVPINFYVNGVPRLFSEGSGDHRVMVTVDGFNVYVLFVMTGIQIRVQVRPFFSDQHSGIMNGRNATIPGSFSTYLCLPADNPKIQNVMGLLGTTSTSFLDDFMTPTGVKLPVPSTQTARTKYCVDNWCVKNAANSLFTYAEAGYDFNTYNGCGQGSARRTLEVDVANVTADVIEVCQEVGGDPNCLEEGAANGIIGAQMAVVEIGEWETQQAESLAGTYDSEDACCSVDFKHCYNVTTASNSGCEHSKYKCQYCSTDGSSMWFFQGPYHTEREHGNYYGCTAKSEVCSVSSKCCPGLECSDVDGTGTCVPTATNTPAGRRLAEFKLVRPDFTENDEIFPLFSEF